MVRGRYDKRGPEVLGRNPLHQPLPTGQGFYWLGNQTSVLRAVEETGRRLSSYAEDAQFGAS